MTRLQTWAATHSVLTALGLVFFFFILFALQPLFSSAAFGADSNRTPQSVDLGQLPMEVGLAASVLILIAALGWLKPARLLTRPDWTGLWAPVLYLAFSLMLLAVGWASAAIAGVDIAAVFADVQIGPFLLLILLIGIFEESLFRGAVLYGFEAGTTVLFAVLASSVLFGAMHYVNWMAGQALGPTTDQVIHAGLSGLLYAAIALRMNSIWFGALTHAAWDGMVSLNAKLSAAAEMAPAVTQTAAASDGGGLFATLVLFLITYFEPIFGVIVLFFWWRRKKTLSPQQ